MTTIHRILVATDFSSGARVAVERAVQLAEAHGASLDLLHAFDASAWHGLKGVFDAQRLVMDPPPDVRVHQHLKNQAQSLATTTGLKVEACFGAGDVGQVIASRVREKAVSLVVVGSRSEPELMGLGSAALKMVRLPPCPVLVVRCAKCHPYNKVLTAVDMGDVSLHTIDFSASLLPAARHTLLLAMPPSWNSVLDIGSSSREQLRSVHDAMHAQAVRQLNQLALKHEANLTYPVAAEVIDEVPARAIVERAAALPADCVAIGHHGQSAVAEPPLGSLALHVLHHTLRDVLVVPPQTEPV